MRKLQIRESLLLPILILGITYLIYFSQFKFIWHDETRILLHLFGYQQKELIEELYDGQPKTNEELLVYQKTNENKTWKDTFEAVIQASPTDSPTYIFLLKIWCSFFGESELALRSLSILIWTFFITCLYYLSWLLFTDKICALISTIFAVLSPRFVNYGLELWEYGLFSLMTVLSSIFLLKAIHSKKVAGIWIFYALSIVLGLYTHIFFIFVVLSHFTYFFSLQKLISFFPRKRLYFISSLIFPILLWLPWVKIGLTSNNSIYSYAQYSWPLLKSLQRWALTVSSLFDGIFRLPFPSIILEVIAVGFFLFSLLYLIQKASKPTYLFILLMIICSFGSLLLIDIVSHSRYSTIGRFYVPALIGVLLSISFLIGKNIVSHQPFLRMGSSLLCVSLIILGAIAKIPQPIKETGFKGYGSNVINTALIINQSQYPLVIGEFWVDILPLSRKIKAKTHYLLIQQLEDIKITEAYSDVYLVNPSKFLREALQQSDILWEKTENSELWRITVFDAK